VAVDFVGGVEAGGVDPVQPVHALAEVGVRGLDHQVVVVAHQAVAVVAEPEPGQGVCHHLEEQAAVLVGLVDGLASVASLNNVVDATAARCPSSA